MSTVTNSDTTTRGTVVNRVVWGVQIFLALFMGGAAAGPKLFGESAAVEMFDVIGFGQWFRIFVGVVELAGAIGLVLPRLCGLAAIGLVITMIGATLTQLFLLDGGLVALTPLALGVVFAAIAWYRRDRTAALLAGIRR